MRGGVRRSEVVIGRRPELSALHQAVLAASGGTAITGFLVGEGGVGKTRLLAECTADARRAGLPVLTGRASPVGSAPFGLIAEALRSWLRTRPLRERPPSPYDAGLRLVLPEWPAVEAQLSDGQLRLLALEGVVHLLREVAGGAGVLVVLDDLHEADPESVEAVRYLASAAVPGVAVVAALRSGEGSLAESVVNGLAQAQEVEVWPVEPLEGDQIGELLGALLDGPAPEELVAEVVARTDGVPLLVEETVDAYVRAGSVTVDAAGAHWRGGRSVVPTSVTAMVAGRLERLQGLERDVLFAASLVGIDDLDLVAAASGHPPASVRSALRVAVDAGLIETVAGELQFRHAIVGDAVRELTPPDLVRDVHRRAEAALAGEERSRERRAHHLLALGDHDLGVELLVDATRSHLAAHAHLQAESVARTSLEAARSDAARAAADDALAAVLAAQGRWSEALELDQAAARDGRLDGERWLRMARCALDARLTEVARGLLDDVGELGADSPEVRVTTGRLAMAGGDASAALAMADDVLAASPTDARVACDALDLRARALDFGGRRDDARAAWSELVRVADAARLTAEGLRAVVNLSELELFDGQPPVMMVEAVELARASGALVEEVWAELNLSIALSIQGDPAAAVRIAGDALVRCRERRLDLLPFVLISCAGCNRFYDEALSDAYLAEALALAGGSTDMQIHVGGMMGFHEVAIGRYDSAITYLEDGLAATRAAPGGIPSDIPHWLAIALVAAGRDDDAAAALALAHDMPDADRFYARGITLGIADALMARDEAAFDAVIASVTARMPFDLAAFRVLAAQLIGGPSSARWLRSALDTYEGVGAVALSDRTRGLLRAAGGAVPRGRGKGQVPGHLVAAGVTKRESEVLALVREGCSNQAIADRLFLSVRTVESHVSSLLAKLGASSRQELAAR